MKKPCRANRLNARQFSKKTQVKEKVKKRIKRMRLGKEKHDRATSLDYPLHYHNNHNNNNHRIKQNRNNLFLLLLCRFSRVCQPPCPSWNTENSKASRK